MAEPEFDIDAVVAEIRESVRRGRESGVYSDELEAELQSDFARQLARPDPALRFDALYRALHSVDVARQLGPERVALESGIPGGEAVHRALSKAVGRQINGLYQQVRVFADSVVPMFDELIRAVSDAPVHVHDDVVHDIDVLTDRVAALQRSIDRLGAAFADGAGTMARLLDHLNFFDGVSPRLAALEERERRRGFDPFFEYAKFEEAARASSPEDATDYTTVADRLAECPGPVIDLGAGRGDLVRLLGERGATAWGVDRDADLVAAGQRAGLDVRLGDAVDALRSVPLASVGGVVLLHVAEHLTPNEVLDVVQSAHRALCESGQLVVETINPQSFAARAGTLSLDPTYTRPLHPVYLDFVVRAAGFTTVDFEWVGPPPQSERLDEIDDDSALAKVVNDNARRVNELLFAAQSYRVTAYR
ncbi:MAG: class I SAM-dependent methyltransferase [Acidimicrobiales bacterium]